MSELNKLRQMTYSICVGRSSIKEEIDPQSSIRKKNALSGIHKNSFENVRYNYYSQYEIYKYRNNRKFIPKREYLTVVKFNLKF